MARVLLATFGSLGDLHPAMGIARQLIHRGHRATIASSEFYRRYVESAGFRFEPMRPDLRADDPQLIRDTLDPKLGSRNLHVNHILPRLQENILDFSNLAQSHDLILSSVLAYAAPIVSKVTKVPWVSMHFSPLLLYSAHDPSLHPKAPSLGKWPLPALIHRWIQDQLVKTPDGWAEPLKKVLSAHGLPARRGFQGGFFSPYFNLCLWPEFFAPKQVDWPTPSETCGFVSYDPEERLELSSELTAFLKAGEPPVVFTMGSSVVQDPGELVELFEATARRIKCRAIITVGKKALSHFQNRSNSKILFTDYAPYAKLFAAASLIVHQGGVGTTAHALLSGKPSIVYPFAYDQFDNAFRIQKRGLGISILRKRLSPKRLGHAIRQLLEDREIYSRCEQAKGTIKGTIGEERACDLLEASFLGRVVDRHAGMVLREESSPQHRA